MKINVFIFNNKFLLNIWKFLEKVSNIIKNKFNSELIYNKKYVTAEKKNKQKKRLSMFICTNDIDDIEKMKFIIVNCF